MLGPAQPLKIIDFTDSGGGGGLSPFSIPAYAFDNNKTDPLNLSNISVSNKKRPRNFLENLYFPTHLQVIYRSFTGHLQVIYRSLNQDFHQVSGFDRREVGGYSPFSISEQCTMCNGFPSVLRYT